MAAKSDVKVHFANGGRKMAKRKNSGGKKRSHGKRPKKKNPGRRSPRRNPAGFGDRAMRLLGGAAVVLGTGIGVTYAMAKIAPGTNGSMYGIPAATFVVGAALAKKMPVLGAGMALGAATPFAVPLASRVLAMGQDSGTQARAAAGLGRMLRAVQARQLGAVHTRGGMGAIDSRYEYA
jgi:hypothetical protein